MTFASDDACDGDDGARLLSHRGSFFGHFDCHVEQDMLLTKFEHYKVKIKKWN